MPLCAAVLLINDHLQIKRIPLITHHSSLIKKPAFMKFVILMFVFLCLHTTCPVSAGKKASAAPKKEVRAPFNLAPSILIINY